MATNRRERFFPKGCAELWQPMGLLIWDLQNPVAREVMYGLFACGCLTVLISAFLINHFGLFGPRLGRQDPAPSPVLQPATASAAGSSNG